MKIVDCNNFWSPSGGGVRRYHLEKLAFFKERKDIDYVFVMQDTKTYTEQVNETTFIEHVFAPKIPGNWEYRYLFHPGPLIKLLKKHKPDIVEVGSPYTMPWLVRLSIWKAKLPTKVICFWHADFPVTYVLRFFEKWNKHIAKIAEWASWMYARLAFGNTEKFFVSSPIIGQRMMQIGLGPIAHVPLGVDTTLFHPSKKDFDKVSRIKAGAEERLTLFFPHRFMEEKGIRTLLKAYPMVCEKMKLEPAIVFAGTGPDLDWVQKAVEQHEHIHYLGYLTDREEMASWCASCDLGLALSGYETFGLSILEAMSSGQAIIGASTGAALEHVEFSGAGVTIEVGSVEGLRDAIVHMGSVLRIPNCEMGKKARAYAQEFTWSHCFKREIEEYENVLMEC